MELFPEIELEGFDNLTDEVNYLSCDKLKAKVQSILSNKRIKENGNYMVYMFSGVIPISGSKNCILMSTSVESTKYEGGKAIGDEVIYIFTNINNNWSLEASKSIAMY